MDRMDRAAAGMGHFHRRNARNAKRTGAAGDRPMAFQRTAAVSVGAGAQRADRATAAGTRAQQHVPQSRAVDRAGHGSGDSPALVPEYVFSEEFSQDPAAI